MFRLSLILFPALGVSFSIAEPIKLSASLFKSPEFKERFVGSYGFLPQVEPKVDREEAQVIAELSELLSSSRFREAEVRLLDFIKERKNPIDPEKESKDVSAALIFTLGNLYFQNDQVADAEKAYLIAIKRHPAFRRAHKNLALLYATKDKIEQAKPHLMKAIDLGESDHRTFGLLGYALLKEEKFLAAEAAYRQAYLLKPDEKDWKLGLAQTLLAKEDWPQAAAMLQTLIDESPENALLWQQQANCFIQNGEVPRAAENYEVLRLKGLADETALNQLGDIYANQDQPLLALGAYLSAMKKSETINVARTLKAAKYLLQLEAPREAETLIDELDDRGGDSMTDEQQVETLLVKSDIAKTCEALGVASDFLAKALLLRPANGGARVKLGELFAERAALADKPEVASDLKQQARVNCTLAVDHTDAKVAFQANLRFAQLLVKDGQYLKALPRLEQAVRLKTGSKQSIEQYLRRVQRAAEREKAKNERIELDRAEKREAAEKAAKEAESGQ